MADGSALATLDEPKSDRASAKAKRKSRAKAKPSLKTRAFKVDLWATDLNTAEIGIMKRIQNEAASDQFTKDMELYGQTVIGGERKALVGYRRQLWDANKDFERRLVIKLFSEKLSWRGTIEMMLGRSMQLTVGAGGMSVPSFSINLARHDQLIQLERSAHKLPMMPETYSFFIQTNNGPRFYRLRRKLISIGSDYTLFNHKGRKIGELDSRVINLGGAWLVKLDEAYSHPKLEAVLQLFCAMLKFKGSSRRHIRRLGHKIQLGKLEPELDHNEDNLYLNPRHKR